MARRKKSAQPVPGETDILGGDTGSDTPIGYQGSAPNAEWGYSPQAVGMMPWMGGFKPKPDRQAPSCDVDAYPRQFRRYVNASGALDVQIANGMRWGVLSGKRLAYGNAGYLNAVVPRIPGQTRDNVAGWHRRGPSPLNYQALVQNGPGSQPNNPGGPGKIAAPLFINPMTG